ncbi:uncharacterized protein LOC143601281 isoform X1 [Bidens hawaiensis]|uniref:uncharacterized protein LOC143601281 isoform X1 n=2 Tax=Bidens hawaiensis TaxID=980011 RepID=UPI00404A40FA
MKSSKESVYKDTSSSGSKTEEEKKHQDSANTASMKSSTVSPSFEYHVRVKDGTSIVVDLNMKRSDWLKRMEKQICICKNHNLTVGSTDKTSGSDASMNSCLQNKFSLQSLSREIGKTLPLVVEKEVITVSGSEQCWSKVDQNSEHVVKSFENSEEAPLSDLSSLQKGSLCSRTGNICNESLLNSTTEVNQEAGGNHSQSTVVNEERIKSAEGMGVSGSEENTFAKSASDDGAKRKKRYHNSDPVHGQSHERILRSTPVFGGKIIERDGVKIRCSSRLQSKVLSLLS